MPTIKIIISIQRRTARLEGHLDILKTRGKSLIELWVTTFLPPPLIFFRFISNFLCICSYSMTNAYVILK